MVGAQRAEGQDRRGVQTTEPLVWGLGGCVWAQRFNKNPKHVNAQGWVLKAEGWVLGSSREKSKKH